MIYYNCYYLRGLAKFSIKDSSCINDFNIINQNRPELISRDSIDLFRQQLRN